MEKVENGGPCRVLNAIRDEIIQDFEGLVQGEHS